MEEALCGILCDQDKWSFDPNWSAHIKFNSDGTGELWDVGDLGHFVMAANFDWKCKGIPKEDAESPAIVDRNDSRRSTWHLFGRSPEPDYTTTTKNTWWFWGPPQQYQILGRLIIEITLRTSVAKTLIAQPQMTRVLPGGIKSSPNQFHLTDSAFDEPREFTISIQKGNFVPPLEVGREHQVYQWYNLRLRFDRSPYPDRQGFKLPDEGRIVMAYYERMTTFVARPLTNASVRDFSRIVAFGPGKDDVVYRNE